MLHNPIFKGFNPDPAICRKGDDYYVAVSTFEWFPGIPIYHSKDMKHWELLTHVLTDDTNPNLTKLPSAKGIWAPCLTYCEEEDMFYVIYGVMNSMNARYFDVNNYLIKSKNIEGPWSEPVYLTSSGFDASILHDDDGKKYIVSLEWETREGYEKPGVICCVEYDPETKHVVGYPKRIWRGATDRGCIEAPHLTKRDGWYYIMCAEGGTGYNHSVTMGRSRNVWGPYEPDPNGPLVTSQPKDSNERADDDHLKPRYFNPDSVLQKSGADVWREFYVNDAGNQIEKFAKSLEARYFQIIRGEDAVEFPEDGYHGDDIRELAQAFYEKEGGKYLDCDEKTRHDALAQFGLSVNIPRMKSDLARYGIQYDQWFFESSLHESGYVADTVAALTDKGYTYEKDGALWLKTSQILAENLRRAGKSDEAIEKLGLKDDVLCRANGFYTYFAADIAYHRNKFAVRGFDKVINIWGADHHGHVARLKGAMDALGLDGEHRLDIVLMQLVKLVRDGEVVRMSKRTGKAISLTDLLDEIPVDACRWFFNAKPETQMEFDLGLAVREDSENPVYYVQYAYARICTLLKALAAEGHTVPAAADADLSVLTADEEKALIKQLAQYPAVVYLAARDYDPSFINRYLGELAAAFHKFYNACRIKGEAENVLLARLKLADTARAVLKNGMVLIGCSAPEKM